MKITKNLTTKKFFALAVGFVLLFATLFGILFGTHRNAHAEDDRPPIMHEGGLVLHNHGHQDYPDYDSVKITDRGIFNNHYCEFNCDEQFVDIGNLISKGFTHVTVSLEFMMREEYDGYQHVYLYSHSNEIESVKLNYYGNDKIDKYHYVFINFKTYDLSEFLDSSLRNMDLVIRYDASGAGKDDWWFKDLYIRVQLSQGILRTKTEKIGNV